MSGHIGGSSLTWVNVLRRPLLVTTSPLSLLLLLLIVVLTLENQMKVN